MPCQASDSEKKIQKENTRYGVQKCTVSRFRWGSGMAFCFSACNSHHTRDKSTDILYSHLWVLLFGNQNSQTPLTTARVDVVTLCESAYKIL